MVADTIMHRLFSTRRVLTPIYTTLRCGTCIVVLLMVAAFCRAEPSSEEPAPAFRIGATATIVEVTSGLPFPARVDTGATTCSIHCEDIKIKDPAREPEENIGKPVRILIKGSKGEPKWIKTKIAEHVVVRTSEREDERYKVPLKLRWQDVEKKVLVTLNDRQKMKYPMLLGRNFLHGDFLVDVTLDDLE